MVMGGGADDPMVGDCDPMGMGCGSDGPMVVVLVRHGFWFTNLLGSYGFWFGMMGLHLWRFDVVD